MIRARAIKNRFLPPKRENRFEYRSIAARAAQKPGFCCAKPRFLRSKYPKYFFRADARKCIRFLGLAQISQKRRNSRSGEGRGTKLGPMELRCWLAAPGSAGFFRTCLRTTQPPRVGPRRLRLLAIGALTRACSPSVVVLLLANNDNKNDLKTRRLRSWRVTPPQTKPKFSQMIPFWKLGATEVGLLGFCFR